MEINGHISQVKAGHSSLTYMNIQDAGYGGIAMWFSTYSCPVYMARKDNTVWILQFENEEWADEWLKENLKDHEITQLEKKE